MEIIRIPATSDVASILEIYKPYILNTAVTFETEVPSFENFSKRISTLLESWPWLVYEADGVIAGYAYASMHRERAAYQWCVESSVYIDERFQKKGIAMALYKTLLALLKVQGYRNVYAVITLPNEKSIWFHQKSGFQWFADFEDIGYKFDRWHTVSWWRLSLNNFSGDPGPVFKFSEIDTNILQNILTQSIHREIKI